MRTDGERGDGGFNILGRMSKDDDLDIEAYTTHEIKTGECFGFNDGEGGNKADGGRSVAS